MADRQYPLVTVGALIISPKKKVLFVKTHKWHNLYALPGGKVELGESCEQAINREVKEETALEIENVRFALLQESIFSDEFYKKQHFVMHDYAADLKKGFKEEDVVLNEEAESYVWVTPEEALQMPIIRQGRALLNWYLKR